MEAYSDPYLHSRATAMIKELYGPNAAFRDGQYEAVEATMKRGRTLVVQRTGWGKSLVYFVCSRLLRERGRGVTLVVSPLLVLMQNQVEAANALGLKCDVLNSTVRDRRQDILSSLERDELDLVLVTPETLFSDDVQASLRNIRIGLFVIDEAHCISDWGHDFRLEYGGLRKIVRALPGNVPVLATTATANDRVIADLKKQLGDDLYVSRGPLSRDSLFIQVLDMPDRVERYAWILENVPKLPGSGIIYCLTRRDCDYLSDFLRKNGISSEAYYSGRSEASNRAAEEKFRKNRLKVLVATIKLGMGYDKGDISFVIHFQMPSNIVSYYQQIGRAGRSIEKAYIFLMYGKEDEDILNYFIGTAFPTEAETGRIVEFIGKHDGVAKARMLSSLNIRNARLDKALSFLENDGFVRREGREYYLTPNKYCYDSRHYEAVTLTRKTEMEQMKLLAKTRGCYSRYIVGCLDDVSASDCGHCANCLGRALMPPVVSDRYIHIAEEYVNGLIIPIEPRKRWADPDCAGTSKIVFVNQPGLCLSKYGDAGYGMLVKQGKYSPQRRFCDELVGKSADVLRPRVRELGIKDVCCVPSLRSDLVKDFAMRLAGALDMRFTELLGKSSARPQKDMENSAHQCGNALDSFFVYEKAAVPKKILLIDDIVDSRWTLTVCGFRLMEAGAENVYPFALADSSNRED